MTAKLLMRALVGGSIALAGILLSRQGADAQTIQGMVTGEPTEGIAATVLVRDTLGLVRAFSRVSDDGRFEIRLPTSGAWVVTLDALGYEAEGLTVFAGDGETRQVELLMVAAPLKVEGVTVEGESRCPSESRGADVVALWNLARVMFLPYERDSGSVPSHVFSIERVIEPRPLSANVSDSVGRWDDPEHHERHPEHAPVVDTFLSTAPTGVGDSSQDALIPGEFITPLFPGADELYLYDYVLPVPRILLSEAFAAGHCFALEEKDGWVGLRFFPNRAESLKYDVEGTIWLSEDASELPFIVFDYTSYPLEDEFWGWVRGQPAYSFEMHLGNRLGGRIGLAFVPELGWIPYDVMWRTPNASWGIGTVAKAAVRDRLRRGESIQDIRQREYPGGRIAVQRGMWFVHHVLENRLKITNIAIANGG